MSPDAPFQLMSQPLVLAWDYVVGMPVSSSIATIPAIDLADLGPDLVTVFPSDLRPATDCITMDLSSSYWPVPDPGYHHHKFAW